VAGYAELHVTLNYSFLRGASHIEELLVTAKALGIEAVAITNHVYVWLHRYRSLEKSIG
jgi:error-prone DNA polymerase